MVLEGIFSRHFCRLQDAAAYLKKGSSVVMIASIAGFHPHKSMAMYGVTKTALLGLTKVEWCLTYIFQCLIKPDTLVLFLVLILPFIMPLGPCIGNGSRCSSELRRAWFCANTLC